MRTESRVLMGQPDDLGTKCLIAHKTSKVDWDSFFNGTQPHVCCGLPPVQTVTVPGAAPVRRTNWVSR